ncbi:hypothetical protein FBEOM_14430 [Fusarium beomiforme]|uniref:Uncharacterized protein n=1 Tax=Fusarium beomiforme TaxID=44412 RepID=A0A9P5DR54_9HYPO|nr:hypothetical protein FBEOM_14430 [Fusarium beomiforme]
MHTTSKVGPWSEATTVDKRHPDNFPYYRQWGFTIYRTYYGPGSDQNWKMLLGALEQQTRLAFGVYEEKEGADQGSLHRLKELFYLDTRDDESLLDGLDIPAIRQIHQGKNQDIADGEFVVKAVSLHWTEGFPGRGWMRIPTGYLLELWQQLTTRMYDTEGTFSFDGEEEELDDYVWPGDMALDATGSCSEVRPSGFHYSGQTPDRSAY